MNRTRVPQENQGGLHRHLLDSLKGAGKRYRRQLERCRGRFSEEAVHDLRVEIRRLLALVSMIAVFVSRRRAKKAVKLLKGQFDVFGNLRDTQVQALRVRASARRSAGARLYQEQLRKLEERQIRKTGKAVRQFRPARVRKLMDRFREEIRLRRKQGLEEGDWALLWQSVAGAFAEAARLNEDVSETDTKTIHRTRLAFKRYRYAIEALAPLLRGASQARLEAMHDHQTLMGNVQDLEVLMAGVGRFLCKERQAAGTVRAFLGRLEARRMAAVTTFLQSAHRLSLFAPDRFLDADDPSESRPRRESCCGKTRRPKGREGRAPSPVAAGL